MVMTIIVWLGNYNPVFFKENRKPYKFFEDNEFFNLPNTLDNHMKQLSKEGKIAPHEKALPISV